MKKFIITLLILISYFFVELKEVYSYTCLEVSSYTMQPMGWNVRRFSCTAVHPITGAIIVWNKIVVSDGNGGTVFEDEDFNRKIALPDVNNIPQQTVSIYPNPAIHYINLQTYIGKGTKINVSLYDLQLRNVALLYDDIVNSERIRLTLPNLSSGNYIITINDGFNIVSKLISIIK